MLPRWPHIFEHLEPGGHALIPIEQVNPDEIKLSLGGTREKVDCTGAWLTVTTRSIEVKPDGQSASLRLLYERIPDSGEPVSEERVSESR